MSEDMDGVQGRPSQNVPLWQIDYFELKLHKKELMQGGHPDGPLLP